MSFVVVGTNHKHSPIQLREKLYFSKERLRQALTFLEGAVILSTCNRTEIYASVDELTDGINQLKEFLLSYPELDRGETSPYLYSFQGKEAIKHLFAVAAGLDSLILGETQILGQVKSSFFEAEQLVNLEENLKQIFYSSFAVARKIRSETRISEGKVSVGSVAINFIKERIGNISAKNILIIGVGKVTDLVLKYLQQENPNVVFVSNRTFKKAKKFAGQIGAKAVRFDNLNELLKKADIIITATASPHFIINTNTFVGLSERRILIIDLALPRDVDPKIREIKNIELFGLEDLDAVVQSNLEKKSQEIKEANRIIEEEAEKLCQRLTQLEPELVSLR